MIDKSTMYSKDPRRTGRIFVKTLWGISALIGFISLSSIATATDWWPFGKEKSSGSSKDNTAEIVINEAPVSRDAKLTTSFSSVIKQASPSVVSIKTASYVSDQQVHPFLRELFKIPNKKSNNDSKRLRPRGIGSGVIISKDGYILTNNHVIAEADEILVDLADDDEEEFPATIVGTDPSSDLAVLKVDLKELPSATLGNSDTIEVGDIVLAIGNPFGLGQTVTMGIISATGRQQVIPRQQGVLYQDFIQTDASINQGNSGGALIDAEGRLIGINTAIFSRTGENLGIGFAVPINMARNIMEQLIERGKVSRGYLGVTIEEVTDDLAESFGLKTDAGALITKIEEGSPADTAGLLRGDIILKINEREIKNVNDLLLTVSQEPPGSDVEVIIFRDNAEKTFTVKLTERKDETARSMEKPDPTGDQEAEAGGKLFTGILVQDLTESARQQLSAPADVTGALVTKVNPGTPATTAGLRRGMIIMEISAGGKTEIIQSAQDAIAFSKKIKAKTARLYVWDRTAYRYLVLKDN